MKVVIFGATGKVGSYVLRECLKNKKIKSVLSIGRNRTGQYHRKLREVVHSDFFDYSQIKLEINQCQICFYCLGVYQYEVPQEKYWEITVGFIRELLLVLKEDIIFSLLSSQGVDQDERIPIRFSKAKGRSEKLLLKSKIKEKYIFRPGFFQAPKFLEFLLGPFLMRTLTPLFPFMGLDRQNFAKFMVAIALEGSIRVVYDNKDIYELTHILNISRKTHFQN